MSRCVLFFLFLAVHTVLAEEPVPQQPVVTPEQFEALRPGFKALDTLAALKVLYDARSDACMKAFGDRGFCQCLNGRLTLDISFDDYIVLVTKSASDPAWLALSPAKRAHVDDAKAVRDRCVKAAGRR